MKLDQLVALIVRFFAVYLFLNAGFQGGAMMITFAFQYPRLNGEALSYIAVAAVMLSFLFLLWKYPLLIARKIIPEGKGPEVSVSLTFSEIQTLCFTVLGFWVAAESFVALLQYILNLKWAEISGAHVQVRIFGHAVRLAVGIWLMFGARGIAKCIQKLRS